MTEASKPYVRMRALFGESVVPPESAQIIARAVNRAVAIGDVSRNARWQLVEFWAISYLLDCEKESAHMRILVETKTREIMDADDAS